MPEASPPRRLFVFSRPSELWRIPAADRADAERVLCVCLGVARLDAETVYMGEQEAENDTALPLR